MTDSTFKILLTTDNHLGYAERDPRRGDDSFTTFEEILRAARTEHDVDLMLLGGDLFHENKPSLGCLVRACSLFRKYVYGNKEIAFSLLSDPATNFPTHALPMANFQDPNINVALPVFGIHGNHDDPVGGTSSLDLLATNGYLNYFGHVTSLEDIVVEPVLLRKGGTFLALYGLGNVRDERLHRCFRLKKVQFIYPKAVPGRKWFNILIVHQNRGVRGAASKNGILESMLAGFGMDVVIWGNEHEQMMVPQPSDGFDVVQPGSTVLTSLSAQECNPKQYGVLEVRGTSYRLTPYPLRSVRPVVRRTVELRADVPDGRTLDAVETFLHGVMRDMVREAEEQVARIPDDVLTFHPNLKYPLIRLAVDFSDVTSAPYPQPNFNRFGQQYMDVVANPGEVLRPVKPKPERRVPGTVLGPGGVGMNGLVVAVPTAPQLNTLDIRVKVAEVFNSNAKHACTLLSESELSAAVYAFAEKGERDAIDERLMELLHTSQKSVWRRLESGASEGILNPSKVVEEVASHKRQVNERYARAAQLEDVQHQQQQRGRRGKAGEDAASDGEGGEDEEEGSGGVQGSRRGYGDSMNTGIDHPHTRRTMDAFERVRVAPPTAATSREGPSSVAGLAEQGGYDDFGAHTNVSALVQRAIDHDQTLLRGGRAAVGAAAEGGGDTDGQASRRRATRQGVAEEAEGEDDELPGDGLDRSLLDTVIAQAVQQQTGQVKRPRSGGPTSPVPRGLEGDDEGGPYGGGSRAARRHNIDDDDGDANEEEDGVVCVEDGLADEGSYGGARGRGRGPAKKPRTAAGTRSNGGGGGGSGAASRRRGGGGGGADGTARRNAGGAAASSGAGGPTLSLTPHHGAAASRAYASNAQASRAGAGAGAASGAMLDLLSKWTNAPSQQ